MSLLRHCFLHYLLHLYQAMISPVRDLVWTGTKGQQDSVRKDFDIAQQWAKVNNRPLNLGEFGAYEKADMPSRTRWTNYIARQAEKRKWSWSYWQFDSDFIVYDIDKDEWVKPILDALIPR